MPVLLFHPRFHAPIRLGLKRQTIRAPRKRPVRPGQTLALRGWSGAPYRSRQFTVATAVCVSVEPVRVEVEPAGPWPRVEVAGVLLGPGETARFVVADGFADRDDFRRWWTGVRGRFEPFEGVLIRWEPLES